MDGVGQTDARSLSVSFKSSLFGGRSFGGLIE